MNILEKQTENDGRPEVCSKCGARVQYKSHGEYICINENCKNIERDYFGKIRNYLENNGPSSATAIPEETGIPISKITGYIEEGRLEYSRRNQNG